MLCSYCDEFGHADDPTKRVMGVAGLLARTEAWAQFVSKWDSICDEENVPKPFHMVDFVHQKEDFKIGWESEEKRLRVLDRLLSEVENIHSMPIGAAVVLDDFRNLSESQKSRLRSPYFVAFQEVTYNMAFATALLGPQERVSMVYAKLKKFTGPAEGLWNAIKEANLVGHSMAIYTPAEPLQAVPLQAADIWAYSLGHHGEHNPPKKKEAHFAYQRFVSMALSNVDGPKFFTYFDRAQLLAKLGEF
jgi:hypothetical protein